MPLKYLVAKRVTAQFPRWNIGGYKIIRFRILHTATTSRLS